MAIGAERMRCRHKRMFGGPRGFDLFYAQFASPLLTFQSNRQEIAA